MFYKELYCRFFICKRHPPGTKLVFKKYKHINF
jgi:hypothetical protein